MNAPLPTWLASFGREIGAALDRLVDGQVVVVHRGAGARGTRIAILATEKLNAGWRRVLADAGLLEARFPARVLLTFDSGVDRLGVHVLEAQRGRGVA